MKTKLLFLKSELMGVPLKAETLQEDRWREWATNHFPLASPSIFSASGRYLNNFCVGSDPEFSFREGINGRREAAGCGMKAGLAAGCDQNRRLVELRPWPSPSVLEHVAGILADLRWMYRVYNSTARRFAWRAGAFFAGDGMGGHVHFGRKRPTREAEVAALDGLARVFRATGIFSNQEWDRRIQGDRLGQHYGAPGDYRVQRHGYEYRSLPSWLASPAVAFTAIAASKLAILDPEITTTWPLGLTRELAYSRLQGLAKLYMGRDDDAYTLYHILTQLGPRGFDLIDGQDFAPAWGFSRVEDPDDSESEVILPACIRPEPQEIEEMEHHLLRGVPLTFVKVPANFKGSLPKGGGYRWVPNLVEAGTRSGFGDLIHNLVAHRSREIVWDYSNHSDFLVSGALPNFWTAEECAMLLKYYPRLRIVPGKPDGGTSIIVPKALCQTLTIAGFRAILTQSGLFPLWTVDTVERGSFAQWMTLREKIGLKKAWRVV